MTGMNNESVGMWVCVFLCAKRTMTTAATAGQVQRHCTHTHTHQGTRTRASVVGQNHEASFKTIETRDHKRGEKIQQQVENKNMAKMTNDK